MPTMRLLMVPWSVSTRNLLRGKRRRMLGNERKGDPNLPTFPQRRSLLLPRPRRTVVATLRLPT
jgi:hypothetical protein